MSDSDKTSGPYLSVVVPTYNSKDTIEACLKAIRDSSYKDFELIVVDDGSQDETVKISERYVDKVMRQDGHRGRQYARAQGLKSASAEIIVNIDSDIIIKKDTLYKIAAYFSSHKDIHALTGLLSKEHPNAGFFSQYKNLYMHYVSKYQKVK